MEEVRHYSTLASSFTSFIKSSDSDTTLLVHIAIQNVPHPQSLWIRIYGAIFKPARLKRRDERRPDESDFLLESAL